jgi:hypothetical protein
MLSEMMPQLSEMNLSLGALSEVHQLRVDSASSIAEALDRLEQEAKKHGVALDDSTHVIFPLDSRHDLAWAIKEETEKRGYTFSRHIPDDAEPQDGIDPTPEPEGPAEEAAAKMNGLCQRALEVAQGANYSEAMSFMRQALGLAVTHFGWAHHYTGHMLRYLAQVLRATGNDSNTAEALLFLRRLCFVLEHETPRTDNRLAQCLQRLAEETRSVDDPLAARLQTLAERVA